MKKHKSKKNEEYIKAIPEEVRILFGKFYFFSLLYFIFFSFIYPLLVLKYISNINCLFILIVLAILYILMIIDVIKKKGKFSSTFFILLIVLVFTSISFSIVKFISLT